MVAVFVALCSINSITEAFQVPSRSNHLNLNLNVPPVKNACNSVSVQVPGSGRCQSDLKMISISRPNIKFPSVSLIDVSVKSSYFFTTLRNLYETHFYFPNLFIKCTLLYHSLPILILSTVTKKRTSCNQK